MENVGFELNTYDQCVSNRIKVVKQHTVIFHVENVIYSNVNHKINDKFKEWMNLNYGNNGEVKVNRGKIHEYLGMTFYFTEKAVVNINMDDYVERIINELQIKISNSNTYLTPGGNNRFEKGNRESLGKK